MIEPKEIKRARKALGWTQHELSKKADLAFTTVNRAENGYAISPRIERKLRLALGLPLPVGESALDQQPVERNLLIEVKLPDGIELTDDQIVRLRRAMLDTMRHFVAAILSVSDPQDSRQSGKD